MEARQAARRGSDAQAGAGDIGRSPADPQPPHEPVHAGGGAGDLGSTGTGRRTRTAQPSSVDDVQRQPADRTGPPDPLSADGGGEMIQRLLRGKGDRKSVV